MGLAFTIFRTALVQVLGNIGPVLRGLWIVTLVYLATEILYIHQLQTGGLFEEFATTFNLVLSFAFVGVVAVNWHRWQVFGEPIPLLPFRTHGLLRIFYILDWFVVGLCVSFFMILGALLVIYLSQFGFGTDWAFHAYEQLIGVESEIEEDTFSPAEVFFVGWAIVTFFMYLFFRFAMGIVHRALGHGYLSIFESNIATRKLRTALMALGLITAFFQAAMFGSLYLFFPIEFEPTSGVQIIAEAVWWILIQVIIVTTGAALLTQVYQHTDLQS